MDLTENGLIPIPTQYHGCHLVETAQLARECACTKYFLQRVRCAIAMIYACAPTTDICFGLPTTQARNTVRLLA
eukprot:4024892-Amphidinium_carterae.1